MVSRYAVLCDGLVTNIIHWDGQSEYDPGAGCTLKQLPDDSPVGPGWTRSANNRWVAPTDEPQPAAPVALTVDPQALAAFVQAVQDPAVDTQQALAEFAAALSPNI